VTVGCHRHHLVTDVWWARRVQLRIPLAVTLALAACASSLAAPTPARRVVVISIDGLMPDAYLSPDAHGLAVPTLRALVAGGASGRVRGVMPTVTYPSHTTLVTGVPPSVHGITTNKPLDVLGKNFDGWRWYAEDIAVPTIYGALEAEHRKAALVVWPVTVGAHASVVVPEYWRAGGPDDQKLLRALSTPGVLDEVARAYPDLWKALTPPDIKNASQLAIARHVLATRHPELLMVHVFETDDAQHEHGPWSAEAIAAIEAADRELATLLADLKRAPEWPNTILVVVSDHGFAPIAHEIRLPALFAAHKLVRDDSADVGVIASGGTAFVYVLDSRRAGDVDAAVRELGDRVARRIGHDELVAMGGDPKASFALVAAPGYGFSDKRVGDVVVETAPRGTHGWPPDDPAMAASFVAFGPAVPHVALGSIDMLDIAPTLACWLRVPLPSARGKVIAPLCKR
jgi:predicted AlkP superfamily pyrophosphatase or phosphodiesterase